MVSKDWTPRDRAIAWFERELSEHPQTDQVDEHFEQALSALKRSQDHTAIQDLLNETMRTLTELVEALHQSVPGPELTAARTLIAEQLDPKRPRRYWGWRHSSGAVMAVRFFGNRAPIEKQMTNEYVVSVVDPFEAKNREEALRIVERHTRARSRHDREPPEPDGESFRGGEAAAYSADQQARIQRELK